ncbi:hypothetical protein ACFL1H_05440 [Nanoarchaeota archaeon]
MASLLSKISYGVSLLGMGLDIYLEAKGNNSFPPISQHIGNWTYIWASGVIPAMMSNIFFEFSRTNINDYVDNIARKIPKVTTALATTYLILGESIFPYILPGTADIKDIPAALLAGVSTYYGIDYILSDKKELKNEPVKSS